MSQGRPRTIGAGAGPRFTDGLAIGLVFGSAEVALTLLTVASPPPAILLALAALDVALAVPVVIGLSVATRVPLTNLPVWGSLAIFAAVALRTMAGGGDARTVVGLAFLAGAIGLALVGPLEKIGAGPRPPGRSRAVPVLLVLLAALLWGPLVWPWLAASPDLSFPGGSRPNLLLVELPDADAASPSGVASLLGESSLHFTSLTADPERPVATRSVLGLHDGRSLLGQLADEGYRAAAALADPTRMTPPGAEPATDPGSDEQALRRSIGPTAGGRLLLRGPVRLQRVLGIDPTGAPAANPTDAGLAWLRRWRGQRPSRPFALYVEHSSAHSTSQGFAGGNVARLLEQAVELGVGDRLAVLLVWPRTARSPDEEPGLEAILRAPLAGYRDLAGGAVHANLPASVVAEHLKRIATGRVWEASAALERDLLASSNGAKSTAR